jgi:hypothetical protein
MNETLLRLVLWTDEQIKRQPQGKNLNEINVCFYLAFIRDVCDAICELGEENAALKSSGFLDAKKRIFELEEQNKGLREQLRRMESLNKAIKRHVYLMELDNDSMRDCLNKKLRKTRVIDLISEYEQTEFKDPKVNESK